MPLPYHRISKQTNNNMETKEHPLQKAVVEALKTVEDPEIPVNIYDLGLIYDLQISPDGEADLSMTLTNPNCPVADSMPAQVKKTLEAVPGITKVRVRLVFEPEWTKDRMSDAALLEMGLL